MNGPADVAGHRPRVLIVDDERKNRDLLEVMLSPEGYELASASDGEEALQRVLQDPPDLILLDIMMPGLDGYQVVARIKSNSRTSHIPVVMLTALDDRNSRVHGLAAGATDFITKPVDRAELCACVKALLASAQMGETRPS